MKQQRFTTALLQQPSRKEQIIQWLDKYLHWIVCAVITACVWGIALIGLSLSRPTLAVDTDYNNNAVSEQIAKEWQRQASLEFGDIPREPTAEELRYMKAYTAQKQKELDEVRR